jgi:signal transduction histidine kinase
MQQGLIRVEPEKDMVTSFDMQDGLPGNSFPYAHCLRKDGTLLFGGNRGLVAFHPDSVHENLFSPNVALTSFKIFDRVPTLDTAIAETHSLRLNYNENYFSFEFASLDFSAPQRNRFRYRLEGFDKEWTTTARRFAYYTNVDPGEYVLRVVGSNSDGVWNSNGRTLHLVITPPYWATWWFRGLVLVVVTALLAGGYHYRVRKLLEMERMRLRIAGDLHDDIGSSLGSIALLSDLIRNSGNLAPDQTSLLHEISKSARHTADALRDIVWVINPAHDKLDNMVLRMKDAAASMLGNIEHSFRCSDKVMAGVLDMEFRRHVLLMYKEILHNILKHAQATRVDITIEEDDGRLMLTVVDNGVGFDSSQTFSGNGLRNLRSRAEKVGGSLEIRSVRGKGSSFILNAKIP